MAENLPAVPEPDDVDEEPIEGEIVEDEPPQQPVLVVRPVVNIFQSITVVVQHPVPQHAVFLPAAGLVVAYRRWARKRTLSLDMGHAARLQGDHENALKWAVQAELERKQRAERWVKAAETAVLLVRVLPFVAAAILIAMVAFNVFLAIGTRHAGDLLWSFLVAGRMAKFAAEIIPALVIGVAVAVPLGLYVALHELGRHGGDLSPSWTVAGREPEEDRGLVVTADAIVVALRNLSLAKLDKAFKESWVPAFRNPPIKDGEGYSAVFSLPMGVTPAMIADKNDVFARNLHRAKTEVWPTDAERDGVASAGFVNLWVANPGVLDRTPPEWPLLHSGTADVFKGVPIGVTARGNPVLAPIVGNNFSIGGLMGQGKSNACRVVMLGAALDPLAELIVHVFAYNGDFDCFEPRLARYVKGAEAAQVDAAMDTLSKLHEDVAAREQMISDAGAKKVTRQLAARHPQLRPRLTLFSECHVLFGHKKHGAEATELAVDIIRRARKTAIWMGFDTQDSRKDAIPPALLSLVSIRSCLPVTSWRANDGFLWDGAFQSGVRATELRPGRDIGRSITTGVSDEQFEILKWHYIFSDDDTGKDDAAPVIARSMQQLAAGTAVAGALEAAVEERDVLADVAEVIGPDRIRIADLPARLRKLAPAHSAYRSLTGVQLRGLLEDEDVRTTNPKNVPMLDPADLHQAIAERGELAVRPLRSAARSPPQCAQLTPGIDLTQLTTAGQRHC